MKDKDTLGLGALRSDDDPAVLKAVKLSRVRVVQCHEQVGPAGHYLVLERGGTPRRPLYGRMTPARVWSNLSTTQEAACAEFLRESHAIRPALPKLRRLLLLAGCNPQDIDLHGLADEGWEVSGQVTYNSRGSTGVRKKLDVLMPYGERSVHLMFFYLGHGPSEEGCACFVSVDEEVLT